MGKVWLLDLKKMSIFTGIVRIIFTPEIINYRNRITLMEIENSL